MGKYHSQRNAQTHMNEHVIIFYEKGIITTEKKDFILRKYSAHAAFDLLIEKHPVLKTPALT